MRLDANRASKTLELAPGSLNHRFQVGDQLIVTGIVGRVEGVDCGCTRRGAARGYERRNPADPQFSRVTIVELRNKGMGQR
jgi:hypothetical protein